MATDPPTFYEQIQETDGGHVYLCYTNHYLTMPFIPSDEDPELYVPMKRPLWPLAGPFTTENAMSHQELWTAIRQYLYDHIDFQDDRLYDVVTGWVYVTWIPERFEAVPYIYVLGPHDSGKTQLLEALRQVVLRGLETPSISGPGLFRVMEKYHPTLLIDEAQFISAENMGELRAVLNAGYKRGQYALRLVGDDYEPKAFDVFGPKAIASIKPQRDTLESRCLVIHMDKAARDVRFTIDKTRATTLRTQLLLWRLAQLERIERIEGIETLGEVPPSALTFANGRFVEKFYPLYMVSNAGRRTILDYAHHLYQVEQDAEETSIEAEVINAKRDCDTYGGIIKAKDIRQAFNRGRADREKWKTRTVSSIVKRLGFHRKRASNGDSGFIYDATNITRKMRRYRIPEEGDTSLEPSIHSKHSKPSQPTIDTIFPEAQP